MVWRNLALWTKNRRVRRFLSGAADAVATQRQVLLEKIRRNAESDFGRHFGFSQIRSIADFRRQLPISTYEHYRPYVERVKQGETTAMFGPDTRVLMFSMTSGTTGDAKYIPITQEFVAEYRRGWNLWGTNLYQDHQRLLKLLNVQISSDWKKFHTAAGIPCGSISGLAAEMRPLVAKVMFMNMRPLMKIDDALTKHYVALRLALAERRIGALTTANPSTLVELARVADEQKEHLIRDIYDGTLSDRFAVPGEARKALRRRVGRRRQQRARQIEAAIERRGELLPRDCWRNLQVLSVWTGGSVGAYLPQLKKYYGDLPVRDHGLSASEGRVTIPLEDNTSAGVLDYTSQYFEFISEDEHGSDSPTMLEAHELEPGGKYFVVLTTSSGFYRYDIFDLVECTGYYGQAPMLKFLNKGSHFSSITGEKISEFQVADAIRRAFSEMGLSLGLFTMVPRWGDPPGYVLLMEPGPYMARRDELAALVDRNLGQLNIEYADRLETNRLRPLAIQTVPQGMWDIFRQHRLRRGGTMEQYKHPCLTNDLDFIPRLSEMFREAAGEESPVAELAAT